ncbi:cytochrome P450 [Lentinus brumalis]|uniref:Cytochrome P450 n=1 Tax=Lentinus brumalis TaxID=2498619 RepID=A0A371D8F9_9APHY|nr:cytochrome P450 [Polyporus brumalis]
MILQAAGLAFLCFLLYRLRFSPLARLPGSTLCALTRLPLMYHEFCGNRRKFVHALHLQYGPVVRIAPNEVAFASREAAKEIYTSGGSGYDKPSFYDLFSNFDRPNMFSTLEKGKHADIKKRFADRYSKSHLTDPDVASVIQDHADALVAKVSESLGTSQDIYVLLHCFALDAITGHLFHPRGLHSLNNPAELKIMQELSYSNGLRRAFVRLYFPTLWKVYSKLTGEGNRREGLVAAYVLEIARDGTVASHTVLSKIRTANARKSASSTASDTPPWDWKDTASECMDHLVAGIDTTGDGLCFLMHHLSLPTAASERVQQRLHDELVQNPGAPLDDLPYLDAVVKEGLRVWSPIPMSFPRVVPPSGRVVDGVSLPGGTVVSCQPYTMHRLDTGVFPDAEAFVPERWLEREGVMERNQYFFAFASGGRGCIGKHLALLEMKMLLREVYSRYRTRIAPDMTASMEQDDQTISSRPKDQKCLVLFEKWNDDS